MKAIVIDNVKLDKLFVRNLCDSVKILRDGALMEGRMDYAVSLSYVHIILANYIKEVEE